MTKEKKKLSCLTICFILVLLIGIIIGLGYALHIFVFYLQEIIPRSYAPIGCIASGVLLGLASFVKHVVGLVGVRKKKGEIHLSSPLWVDISTWGGYALLAVSFPMLGIYESPLDFALLVVGMLIFTSMVFRLRKDLNDKMIIADDYLSIDEELLLVLFLLRMRQRNKKVIKKNNILKIKLRTFTDRGEPIEFIIITYTELKDGVEVESEYQFEPAERLNISRGVIVKHLKLKGYEIEDDI